MYVGLWKATAASAPLPILILFLFPETGPMREAITAVVARGDTWSDVASSEPYEAAWATEAVIYVRSLGSTGSPQEALAWVQISPDGMRWINEGSILAIPRDGEVSSARIRNFGTYLRVKTVLPAGSSFKALVSIALKG
jgi:hypothetical protein